MHRNRIHLALILVLAAQTSLAAVMARGSVLCRGSDGHTRIETPFEHQQCRQATDAHDDCHDPSTAPAEGGSDPDSHHPCNLDSAPCRDTAVADPILVRSDGPMLLCLDAPASWIPPDIATPPERRRVETQAFDASPPVFRCVSAIVLLI